MENYKVKTSLSPKQKSTQLSSTQCNHLAQFHSSSVPNNEAKENESDECVCENCNTKTKTKLKDKEKEYWWCSNCNETKDI